MKYYPKYSIQKRKIVHTKPRTNLVGLSLLVSVFIASFIMSGYKPQEPVKLVSPIPERIVQAKEVEKPISPTPTPSQCAAQECVVMKLIIDQFGKNAPKAIAIAKAESGLNPNQTNFGKASKRYPGECSVGLFQINLMSDGCSGHKVHWNRAEGKTLEEKIEWLKVPENNVKVAKQIFDEQGWRPWSAFLNGSYKNL